MKKTILALTALAVAANMAYGNQKLRWNGINTRTDFMAREAEKRPNADFTFIGQTIGTGASIRLGKVTITPSGSFQASNSNLTNGTSENITVNTIYGIGATGTIGDIRWNANVSRINQFYNQDFQQQSGMNASVGFTFGAK